jgi:tetratricopeptide (TPR) repeat protein
MTLPDLNRLARMEALRQVPSDPPAVEHAVAAAEAALASARAERDDEAVRRLLGYLGGAYRMLGRLDAAIAAHEEERALAEHAADGSRLVVALIRLGEAYRCADRYDDAAAALRDALALAPPDLEHFALQHLGKVLLDGGDVSGAEECLERSLELRRALGDPELVASTEQALAAARAVGRWT